MIKSYMLLGMLALATASPAYYGYSPSPKYSPVPKPAYAIPSPSYAAPKASYVEPSYHAKPHPYSFGYNIDDGYGNNNHQTEEGDEYGHKRGSYGYTDAYGIYRKVDYVADDYGFHASITTNEPGTASANPADVKVYAKEPPASNVYAAPAYLAPSYAPSYAKPYASYAKPTYYDGYKRHYDSRY